MSYKTIVFLVSVLTIFGFLFGVNAKAITTAELQEQIAALQAQLAKLQQQLAELQGSTQTSWCHNFNINLKIGDTGQEVSALMTALQKEGISITGANGFDEIIASAVTEFQNKYASEILTPVRLRYGNGFVGQLTRAKLNKLFGCSTACIQVITYATNPITKECKAYPTPCDVPSGWTKVSSCAATNCTDSDGGKNYYIKGQTYGRMNPISSDYSTQTDHCDPQTNNLIEYTCGYSDNILIALPNIYTCQYGCENGVCKISDCSYRYWYDGTSKICGYKQFCGSYMYNGLHTFTTKAACEESLNGLCIQVITYAKNNITGECKAYPTPCDVPSGWTKVSSCPSCTNECITGTKKCSGGGFQECGNYDNDSCSEWGEFFPCPPESTCFNGICVANTMGCNQQCKSISYALGICKSYPVTPSGLSDELNFLKYYDKIGTTSDCFTPTGMVGASYNCYCYPKKEVPVCTESDGGRDYYKAGTVTDKDGKKYVDTCSNETVNFNASIQDQNNLIEHYCDNGVAKNVNYSCPYGCKDGACMYAVKEDCKTTPFQDIDGDGCHAGFDSDCGGIEGVDNPLITCFNNKDDDCDGMIDKNDNDLSCNLTCGDGICGWYEGISSSSYYCPKDCQEIVCTDSDGGKNYYLQGVVKDSENKTYIDTCSNETVNFNASIQDQNNLIEHYCDNGVAKNVNYSCPYGCKDGVCLQRPSYIVEVISPNGGETYKVGDTFKVRWRTYNVSDSMLQQFSLFDDRIPGWQIWSAGAAIPTTYGKLISSVGNEKIYEYSFVIPKNFNSTSPQQYQNIFGGNHYRVLITAVVSGIAGTSSSVSVDDYSDGLFSIEPNDTCVDSDGGKNYYTKGTTITSAGQSYTDYCVEPLTSSGSFPPTLLEYSCPTLSDSMDIVKTTYTCPYGCFNGVCKKTNTTLNVVLDSSSPSARTIDQTQATDIVFSKIKFSAINGDVAISRLSLVADSVISSALSNIRIYNGSTLIGSTNSITLLSINLNPYIKISSGSGVVITIKGDLTSSSEGSIRVGLIGMSYDSEEPYNLSGSYVSGGTYGNLVTKVNTQTSLCTDSDGGKDYYVKGTVKAYNTSQVDYCSGSVLLEYSCLLQKDISAGVYSIVKIDPYICANGCENGACKKTSDCSYRYWYDDTSKVCGYKQFCGTYIYNGLKTFTTKAACESSLESIGCLNVITYAKNPSTGECRVHINSCGILPGWVKVDSCSTSTQPISQNSQLSILYASLFQLLEELELLKK
ncbi:MAG: hypothetical protein WC309_00810 [Candidatus Paceibacterota bacterium]|jgi:uncharacterized protein YbdZ (MbtH family)